MFKILDYLSIKFYPQSLQIHVLKYNILKTKFLQLQNKKKNLNTFIDTIQIYCQRFLRGNTTVVGWKLGAFSEIFLSKQKFFLRNVTKGFSCTYLKVYKKKFNFFFSKWQLYTMAAEEPLNLRCSAAGSIIAVILAVKNFVPVCNE